jgi:hypothetical protein
MTVRNLHDLIATHTAALREAEPPAEVVIKPALLLQLLAEDAAGGDESAALFTPNGQGGYDFMGFPVSADPECPSAVVFSSSQAAQWRRTRAEQAHGRMFPAWDR